MVDGNWGWRIAPDRQPHRWDLKTAISVCAACEEHGVYWLEEPLDAYDYDGLAEVRRRTMTLRIAGGELNRGPEEIRTYLERRPAYPTSSSPTTRQTGHRKRGSSSSPSR